MKTHLWPVFLVSLVLSAPANGQTPNEAALRYSQGLDLSSMDKSIGKQRQRGKAEERSKPPDRNHTLRM